MKIINAEELKEFLSSSEGWIYKENRIEKEFVLSNFANALSFIVKCGIEAEKLDHHPDMLLYGWNKVRIQISTHSLGGLTQNDFNLAQQIDKID